MRLKMSSDRMPSYAITGAEPVTHVATRVVMVDFPSPGMKVVGLVMRTFKDAGTGEELAAVYVPTTPNPTSGFLEIIPVRNLIFTNMTMDQAMTMIISGGSILPEGLTIGPTPQPPSPDTKPDAS